MSKFLNGLKELYTCFLLDFCFSYYCSLLFLILPGEPKFKYEYQKGFPWRHENLVAPLTLPF